MKGKYLIILALLTTGLFASEESKPALSFELEQSLASKYIWRGTVLDDGRVNQGGITASYGKFSAGIWYNLDLSGGVNKGDITEFDYTLSYSDTYEDVSYELGFIHYHNPFDTNTSEIYGKLSFDKVYFAPTATLYIDVSANHGWYLELSAEESIDIDLSDSIQTLELSATLGFASKNMWEGYYGDLAPNSRNNFSDLSLKAALPIKVCDNAKISPYVLYTTVLNAAQSGASDGNFVVGVDFAMSF